MTTPELVAGTVKWFNAEKGFGFISTATHGDVFVHVRALAEGRTTLAAGEAVYFQVRQSERGPEAAHVRAGAPPAPPKPAVPTLELPTPALPGRPNMRLVGRPAEVRRLGHPGESPSLVACVFELDGLAPAMPGGLPPPGGATACLALIAIGRWRRVERALEENPADTLVIDGHIALDPLVPGMITLRATSVETAAQARAKREAQEHARETAAAQAGTEDEV